MQIKMKRTYSRAKKRQQNHWKMKKKLITLKKFAQQVELIQIETSISNGFVGFQFRKIFSKWNGTL